MEWKGGTSYFNHSKIFFNRNKFSLVQCLLKNMEFTFAAVDNNNNNNIITLRYVLSWLPDSSRAEVLLSCLGRCLSSSRFLVIDAHRGAGAGKDFSPPASHFSMTPIRIFWQVFQTFPPEKFGGAHLCILLLYHTYVRSWLATSLLNWDHLGPIQRGDVVVVVVVAAAAAACLLYYEYKNTFSIMPWRIKQVNPFEASVFFSTTHEYSCCCMMLKNEINKLNGPDVRYISLYSARL